MEFLFDWLYCLASMFLLFISWKNHSESDSNNIVPLCHYSYSFVVNITVLIQF